MKSIKRILSIILMTALCFTLIASLASCNKDPDGKKENPGEGGGDTKVTYTVTVKDNQGNPVSGVGLFIFDRATVNKNITTDAQGKVEFDLDAENTAMGVWVMSVPSGYDKPAFNAATPLASFGNSKNVEITVNKTAAAATTTYTVKVVDQNGDAVEGVEVQICHTVCVSCPLTDANGETEKALPEAVGEMTLKVGILNVPAGYTKPEATIDGSYHATIAPGDTEVTVVITKN